MRNTLLFGTALLALPLTFAGAANATLIINVNGTTEATDTTNTFTSFTGTVGAFNINNIGVSGVNAFGGNGEFSILGR